MSNLANAGGAVYVRGGSPLFERCAFLSNVAHTAGGALAVNGGRVSLHGCNFSANAATTSGGAIYLMQVRPTLNPQP